MPFVDSADAKLRISSKKRKLSSVRAEEFLIATLDALYPSSSSSSANMSPTSTNLTVYGDPFSANTRLVTIVLELLELEYEFRHVDVLKGDNLSPAFQKVESAIEQAKLKMYILTFV
jgi:hypothetical protein